MSNAIRMIALGLLQRPCGRILLDKGFDKIKQENFYRLLGGGVEFGEKGAEALVREFREEIGKDIEVTEFIYTSENIFEWNGKKGHELALIYTCRFKNAEDYAQEEIRGVENENNHSVWRSVEEIHAEGAQLYPEEIVNLLKK